MKTSPSMDLVWHVAVQEAVAAKFAEIEPGHFLAALLKFAELPVEEVGRMTPDENVARELSADVQAIRDEFRRRSIDTTRVRRELRAMLGNGGRPSDASEMIHRSDASRRIFDDAVRLADEAGSEALIPQHLLEALFASPTPAIRGVLGEVLAPELHGPPGSPVLGQYGGDLAQMAAEGQLPTAANRTAETKALLRLLCDSRGRSLLLVTDDGDAVRSVVVSAARAIASAQPPPPLKGKRIIDVTSVERSRHLKGEVHARLRLLEKLLAEAAAVREFILFVPPIKAAGSPNQPNPWVELLKSTLVSKRLQCVCQVTPIAYERCIKRDPDWGQCAHVMWVHEPVKEEIPSEL